MGATIEIAGDIAVVQNGVWSHGHPRIERLLQIVSDAIQVPDSAPSRDEYLAARMVQLMDAKRSAEPGECG